MPTRIFFLDNEVLIDTIPTPFVAGSLVARMSGNVVEIGRVESDFVFTAISWDEVAARDGTTFSAPNDAMAYVTSQLTMRRPVGTPQRSYAVAVTDRQTIIPLAPAPVDVNSVRLIVNSAVYAPPNVAADAATLVWLGEFDLSTTDDVVVEYF